MIARRGFVSAALLATLPTLRGDETAAQADGCDSESSADLAADGTRAVSAPGSLEVHTDELVETAVRVTSHPEGTALELAGPNGTSRVTLLPDQVAALCEALHDAVADTDPARVAELRAQRRRRDSGGGE